MLRFSDSYLATARLPRVVQPTLNRLAAQAQQSFSAPVLDGVEVVIIGRSRFDWKRGPDEASKPARVTVHGLHLGAPAARVRLIHRGHAAGRQKQKRADGPAVTLRSAQGHTVGALNVVMSGQALVPDALQRDLRPLL